MRDQTFALALAITIYLVGTGQLLSAQDQTACTDHLEVGTLSKPDEGWNVDFARKSRILRRTPHVNSDGTESGLTVVQHKAAKIVVAVPRIVVNTCNRSGGIDMWYLVPSQVLGFEKNGHLFAYLVTGQLTSSERFESPRAGAITSLAFYDTTGNGMFDTVRIAVGVRVGMPPVDIPDWVNTQPSRRKR
jgi:hypothetical protein